MIRPIVNYLIRRHQAKTIHEPSVVHGNLIDSMAIVACRDQPDFQIIEDYVKDMRRKGIKTVDFYVAFPNPKTQALHTASLKDFPFNPKSIGFFGAFKSPELEQISGKEYDVLVDLSDGVSMECDLVVARINAKWKAGKRISSREHLLDFMIDTNDSDTRNFIHNLSKYLTGFNNLNAA
jgi:triacylglycerol esterase/lipase EstA (alpha/beta hydrolase family)